MKHKKLYALILTVAMFFSAGMSVAAEGYYWEGDFLYSGVSVVGYYGSDSNVVLPDCTEIIDPVAFYERYHITSVSIPSSVFLIELYSQDDDIECVLFEDCYQLKQIYVSSGNYVYSSKDGILYDKDKTELIRVPEGKTGSYTVPNTVKKIGECSFLKSNLTSVSLPSSVKTIGNSAFYKGFYLKSISIPNSVTKIGRAAFFQTDSLASLTIPASVKNIGEYAFDESGIKTLNLLSISPKIGEIGPDCSISTVNYAGTAKQWTSAGLNKVFGKKVKVNYNYKPSSLKITAQPKSQSVKSGSTVKLSVKASGSKLSYQWYYKKKGASSWTKWNKKTAASVSFKADKGWNGAQFYCLVKDGSKKSVKSSAATVTVKAAALKITSQPANKSVKSGKSVTFSVRASGSGLKYQWYYKKKGAKSWTKWNKKKAASASFKPNTGWNGAQFYCLVKDSAGSSVKSKAAKLTVKK